MWKKLPLLLRVLLAAMIVTGTATVVWGALVETNLRISPSMPWGAVTMTGFLVFYWRFLKGEWWPRSTSTTRREGLRAEKIPVRVLRWALLAGGLGLVSSVALFILSHSLFRWQERPQTDLSHIPTITLLPSLLMSAVVAGVSEEAGFRGYMQGPLERRYGPFAAIATTSVAFGLAHLNHGAFWAAILFDIGWGALYGLLTYLSGSIVPAIILHSSADSFEFLAIWKFQVNTAVPLVWERGPDGWFWFNCALVVMFGGAAVWAFLRLARARSNS